MRDSCLWPQHPTFILKSLPLILELLFHDESVWIAVPLIFSCNHFWRLSIIMHFIFFRVPPLSLEKAWLHFYVICLFCMEGPDILSLGITWNFLSLKFERINLFWCFKIWLLWMINFWYPSICFCLHLHKDQAKHWSRKLRSECFFEMDLGRMGETRALCPALLFSCWLSIRICTGKTL